MCEDDLSTEDIEALASVAHDIGIVRVSKQDKELDLARDAQAFMRFLQWISWDSGTSSVETLDNAIDFFYKERHRAERDSRFGEWIIGVLNSIIEQLNITSAEKQRRDRYMGPRRVDWSMVEDDKQ